jgi:hypothetical protein
VTIHIYSNIRICWKVKKDENLENNNNCRCSVHGCGFNNSFSFRLMVVFYTSGAL